MAGLGDAFALGGRHVGAVVVAAGDDQAEGQ
jgi:hypothetical protein